MDGRPRQETEGRRARDAVRRSRGARQNRAVRQNRDGRQARLGRRARIRQGRCAWGAWGEGRWGTDQARPHAAEAPMATGGDRRSVCRAGCPACERVQGQRSGPTPCKPGADLSVASPCAAREQAERPVKQRPRAAALQQQFPREQPPWELARQWRRLPLKREHEQPVTWTPQQRERAAQPQARPPRQPRGVLRREPQRLEAERQTWPVRQVSPRRAQVLRAAAPQPVP